MALVKLKQKASKIVLGTLIIASKACSSCKQRHTEDIIDHTGMEIPVMDLGEPLKHTLVAF